MNSFKTLALAAGVAVGLASQAHAGSTYTYAYYDVYAGPGQGTVTAQVIDPTLGVNVDAYIGAIILVSDTEPQINAYCIDIVHDLLGSGVFTSNTAAVDATLNASQINTIDALIYNSLYNNDNAAAVQFAIWETVYGGDISFVGADADQATATTYLADVANGSWTVPRGEVLNELTPEYGINQDLVYDTPEPGDLAVLGIAMLGLGFVKRRTRRG